MADIIFPVAIRFSAEQGRQVIIGIAGAEEIRGIVLAVRVDHQHALVMILRQDGGQIDGGDRLSNATFQINN